MCMMGSGGGGGGKVAITKELILSTSASLF